MMINLLDRIGDWNPQLFREIKGRLKIFPMLIAAAISFVGQSILLLINLGNSPGDNYPYSSKYCTIRATYEQQQIQLQQRYHELQNQFYQATSATQIDASLIQKLQLDIENTKVKIDAITGSPTSRFCPLDAIDIQAWWHDQYGYLFQAISIILVFVLLVAGTYLLTSDLVKEERRGTLNFLRLTPQSAVSIMLGKMLGVPILIYLIAALTIPLHFWAGIRANIPWENILGFWLILAASCALLYPTAILISLFNSLYSSFLPWIGSSLVIILLTVTLQLSLFSSEHNQYASAWLMLLSPFNATAGLFPELFRSGSSDFIMQWYYLNIGANTVVFVAFTLFNYALCTYWIWQCVKRCFHNPNATILSKTQSYCLVLCFEVITIGFAVQEVKDSMAMIPNLILLCLYNTVLLFAAIAILSPSRQAIQDWARYRHKNSDTQGFRRNSLLQDLLRNEKSPAILAMAVNLAIATIPILVWLLLPIHKYYDTEIPQIKAGVSVALFIGLMLIYATIAQIMLMLKNNQRVVWAVGTVSAAIALPPFILGILGVNPASNPAPWLWSTFPWAGVEFASVPSIVIAVCGQLSFLALLNFHLTRQVRLAGESATKALVRSRE